MKKSKIINLFKREFNSNIILGFIVGILCTSLFYSYLYNNKMKIDLSLSGENKGKIIAKVNNVNIYMDQVHRLLSRIDKNLTFDNINKEQKEEVIKKIFIEQVVLNKALKHNSYKKHSPFLARLAIQEVRDSYLNQRAQKKINENQIKEKYNEIVNNAKGKKEYLVSHILTSNKKDINKAKNSLNKNSFADVAKKFSIDSQTAEKGGEIGYIIEGSIIKEFEQEILKLKKNKISKPFKTKIGWHIVKLQDTRITKIPEYKDVKDNIEKALINTRKQEIIAKITQDIEIEIY